MCSFFQFPGLAGIVVGVALFVFFWLLIYVSLSKGPFDMDIKGKEATFLPLFTIYVDIAKFVIGFASTSIAALIGATIFSSNKATAPLLKSFSSPLFLLALSLIFGILFMSFLALDYEDYRHNQPGKSTYTRFKYSRNQAFGFDCLSCFALGYLWLIVIAVAQH